MKKDKRLYIISRETFLEKRETITACIICSRPNSVFLRDSNICAKCVGEVPSYIPDEQVVKYLEIKVGHLERCEQVVKYLKIKRTRVIGTS